MLRTRGRRSMRGSEGQQQHRGWEEETPCGEAIRDREASLSLFLSDRQTVRKREREDRSQGGLRRKYPVQGLQKESERREKRGGGEKGKSGKSGANHFAIQSSIPSFLSLTLPLHPFSSLNNRFAAYAIACRISFSLSDGRICCIRKLPLPLCVTKSYLSLASAS